MNTDIEIPFLSKEARNSILNGIGNIIHAIPSLECTEPGYPSTAVILEIPGLCQVSTYTCGFTATWSIASSLGYLVPIKDWFQKCHKAGCSRDRGMDIDQMQKALKSLRLKLEQKRYRGRMQVEKLIDSGQPILIGTSGDDAGHWMYVYGYSPRHVYIGNVINPLFPFKSKEAWTWRRFEQKLAPRELYIINR